MNLILSFDAWNLMVNGARFPSIPLSACLGCNYNLPYCLFFILFADLTWVIYLFYLNFTFYLQYLKKKLGKLFLNRHNLLVCVFVYLCFNNFIYQTQKKGVREREKNKSKHNSTWAKWLFIWHFPTSAFYLSAACHIVMSTPHTTRFQKETSTVLKKIKEK